MRNAAYNGGHRVWQEGRPGRRMGGAVPKGAFERLSNFIKTYRKNSLNYAHPATQNASRHANRHSEVTMSLLFLTVFFHSWMPLIKY
jgi:hypothetical protein